MRNSVADIVYNKSQDMYAKKPAEESKKSFSLLQKRSVSEDTQFSGNMQQFNRAMAIADVVKKKREALKNARA
tara:strand:+ start:347 stop:565 length:219 start_codon:yes stop_codon:yes gene_type:complete